MIVDSDADLDDAVPAIVASAFAYAGQKCSAAARVLVHEAILEEFAERLGGAIELLEVGQADDFATQVPPLIEQSAQQRVLSASFPSRYLSAAGSFHRRLPSSCRRSRMS